MFDYMFDHRNPVIGSTVVAATIGSIVFGIVWAAINAPLALLVVPVLCALWWAKLWMDWKRDEETSR